MFTNEPSLFDLQDYYLADWVNNTILLIEVANVVQQYQALQDADLFVKYPDAKLMSVKQEDWAEFFHIIEPSGVLWHVAESMQ